MRGAQTRLGLARLRLDTAGRSGGGWGTLEAATCLPQRQDLSSRTLRKKGERRAEQKGERSGHIKREKDTPPRFILDQGPPQMFLLGQVRRLSKLRLWGEKKTPTTCRPGSPRAECAPQRPSAFAQGGPLFPERVGGSGKTPLLLLRKGCFPRGSGARLAAKTVPVPFVEGGSFLQTSDFVVQTPKLFKKKKKTPSNSEEPNPNKVPASVPPGVGSASEPGGEPPGEAFLVSAPRNYVPQSK